MAAGNAESQRSDNVLHCVACIHLLIYVYFCFYFSPWQENVLREQGLYDRWTLLQIMPGRHRFSVPAGTKQEQIRVKFTRPRTNLYGIFLTAAKSILPLIAFRRRTESSGTNETILSFGILHLCRPGISRRKTSRGVVFLC